MMGINDHSEQCLFAISDEQFYYMWNSMRAVIGAPPRNK